MTTVASKMDLDIDLPTSESQMTEPSMPDPPADLFHLPPEEITSEKILTALSPQTDTQALFTCANLILTCRLTDPARAREVIEIGLSRGAAEAGRIESEVRTFLSSPQDSDTGFSWKTQADENAIAGAVDRVLQLDESLSEVLRCYAALYEAQKRLDTFEVLSPSSSARAREQVQGQVGGTDASSAGERRGSSNTEAMIDGPEVEVLPEEDLELDDPWAGAAGEEEGKAEEEAGMPVIDDPWESGSSKSVKSEKPNGASLDPTPSPKAKTRSDLPPFTIGLPVFLSQPTALSAIELATSVALAALKIVCERHANEVFPYRFAVLESVPAWVPPGELDEVGLLPRLGEDGKEKVWESRIDNTLWNHLPTQLQSPSLPSLSSRSALTATELSEWYMSRVDSLDSLGLLDQQLAWVQHGASAGIPSLDALGEDLSLLSRLVYDAHLKPAQHDKWNLIAWRRANESDIISAYISNSTPASIVGDIRRLVLPYLYVLESRAERSGKPDINLVERLLHDTVLSLPLSLALPVFELSKATLSLSERLIRNDVNVARLALAVLYGSDDRDSWSVKSAIFECLPVWDVSGGDLESDKEATSMTLDSIATFVRPTKSSIRPPTAKDLFIFFHPLPFASLSRALDILDVHLESGEILARWDVPVQLRFLLQSARDAKEQRDLAERMVRRHTTGRSGETWVKLWEDMRRLSGGEDALLRGAFGMLSVEQMMKVYLGGVLSSGNLDVARRMIRRFETEHDLQSSVLEQVVLETSRELYDNAETGNIHTGEMKIAYDCLSVAPSTPSIQREKAFIEATSRLASFSSLSLTPLEIRHTKNRLDLIRRVLSASDDAYKHDGIVLDLSGKLGLTTEAEKGEVLGMLADSAVRHGEYEIAFGYTERLINMTTAGQGSSKSTTKPKHEPSSSIGNGNLNGIQSPELAPQETLRSVTWKSCLELGRQTDYPSIPHRLLLLGRAIEFCPAETVPTILKEWHKVEDGHLRLSQAAKRRRIAGIPTASISATGKHPDDSRGRSMGHLEGGGEERVLGSRTAARAAKMAFGFGERFRENLPISVPIHFPSGVSPRLPSLSSVAGSRDRSSSRDRAGATSTSPIIDKENGNGNGEKPRGSMESDRISLSGLGFGDVQSDAERVQRQAKRALVKGVGWLLGADEREIA